MTSTDKRLAEIRAALRAADELEDLIGPPTQEWLRPLFAEVGRLVEQQYAEMHDEEADLADLL